MKTARELYQECESEHGFFWGPSDYGPILGEFGEIALRIDDDDYQGDSRVLYMRAGERGYLQFGWGSCSGCDALQACNSYDDIDELIAELRGSVRWFPSALAALEFFKAHDWEGDYSFNSDGQKQFVSQAITILEAEAANGEAK